MTDPMDRLGRLLDDLPGQIAEARERAADLAGRQFVAESTDGSVTATVDGAGRLTGIGLSVSARRLDNLTLGDRIGEAINTALAEVDRERAQLLTTPGSDQDLAGAEELFEFRMDQLQRTLDSIESRLRGLAG
jgi:DNA-binding protein YbaB